MSIRIYIPETHRAAVEALQAKYGNTGATYAICKLLEEQPTSKDSRNDRNTESTK